MIVNDSILDRDSSLSFPHFLVLKASAGSGKTYALSQRYVQFLLSPTVPHNRMRNIIAMTFSNNAAKEMRERILLWLKKLALGDEESLEAFGGLIDMPNDMMSRKATEVLNDLLEHYGDFQVCTIDSFTTMLFQASAVEAGYPPDFEIVLDTTALSEYAFQRFLRRVTAGSSEAKLIDDAVDLILAQKQRDSSYLWNPGERLLEEIREILHICAARGKKLVPGNTAEELRACSTRLSPVLDEIGSLVEQSGLVKSGSSVYTKSNMPELARQGAIVQLVGKTLKNPPVNKPKKATPEVQAAYDRVLELWADVQVIVSEATRCFAVSWHDPYVAVHEAFRGLLEETKRRQGTVFIEDINGHLAAHLREMTVPDIYFRLGETIHHFFIDEFQDTSPAQWQALTLLLENAVSERGSIFLVGDTKQAIYGFRDADYRIMADACRHNQFPSAKWDVRELQINRRSGAAVLEAAERIFRHEAAGRDEYRDATAASGLDRYVQHPDPRRTRPGLVRVAIVEKSEQGTGECEYLFRIVDDLLARNYRYGDIAVLTQRNEDAVRVTGWLNDRAIPFVSFSSLDIRRRPVTAEIIALLRFLDAPTDNLSLVTVLLGTVFSRACAQEGLAIDPVELHDFLVASRSGQVLYPLFAERYPGPWNRYFSMLLKSVGYLPLYDLVSQIYHTFGLFMLCSEEEATLMRLLETVKDFEGLGYNSLSEFLCFAATEEGVAAEWQMTLPAGQNAVRVMTVHKAKGLGFPVAILLLYEQKTKGFGALIDEDEETMKLLKVSRDMAACHELLDDKYQEAKLKETVNGLNSLYVGLTRSREELHVIGVAGNMNEPKYPVDLFTILAPESGERAVRESEGLSIIPPHTLRHAPGTVMKGLSAGRAFHLHERRRGELLHAVLAQIPCLMGDPADQIAGVICDMTVRGMLPGKEMVDTGALIAFLASPHIMPFFVPMEQRSVLTEFEIAARDGRLFRIDRLILDAEKITVIDFKTSADDRYADQHERQVKTYMELVRECFPGRPVEGILASLDCGDVRRIIC